MQFCNDRNLLGPEKLIQLVAEYSGFTEVEVSITPLLPNRKKNSCNINPNPNESFFDYEYLREFEAKIGTARKVA